MKIYLLLFLLTFISINAQVFERVTDLSNPIVSTAMATNYSGAAWIDYNYDGLLDLYSTPSFLFKNLGDGNFEFIQTNIGENLTGQSNGVTWSDYDNDGDLDVFIAARNSSLYENKGNDTFARITLGDLSEDEDLRGWAAAWGDYNIDGYTDLVITHPAGFLGSSPTSNHLFINNGGFLIRNNNTPITQDIAPFTIPSFIDYDLDGDLDLFIGSGPAGTPGKDFIYKNNLIESGEQSFVRIADEAFATDLQDGQVWNFIDYDNDGDLDGFVTNYGGAINHFYQNDNGVFSSVSNELTIGGSKLANVWGDIDNDGDLDVIVTGDSDNDFYINNGDGTFTSFDNEIARLLSISATLGDYDNDGDLDLFLSGAEPALFKNASSNGNNWVMINLEGTASNKTAIGAKVKAKANIDGEDVWQFREVSSQNSFNGHNSFRVHFGLKDASFIDSLIIIWPNNTTETFENVAVNNMYKYVEPIPSGYLRGDFNSDINLGFDLPTIQFSDRSLADPSMPITQWEWDFDNNGVVDATTQNPTWKYDSLGAYTVRLKVSSSIKSFERIKENYITLIKKPGFPIIDSASHSFTDTVVAKGEEIEFSIIARDTSGYDLNYKWHLNTRGDVSNTSDYTYRAFSFPSVPRIDTLKITVGNGFNQTTKEWHISVEDPVGVVADNETPNKYSLNQNYPNPFNPTTKIKFSLPENTFTNLSVYNILGKRVETLVNKTLNSGNYSIVFDATKLSNGVYFYRLETNSYTNVLKMILLK